MYTGKIQNHSISFKGGKVHTYLDFDGTYCPAKHSSLHNPTANPHMPEYCKRMENFWNATKNDLHFHITTGRTFGEYEAVSHLLRMRNFHLPLPQTLITKNGSDEFIKVGSDKEFYESGKFPFDYSITNQTKENKILNQTGWNGSEIKKRITEFANKWAFRFVEADSENSVSDYGNKSIFSSGKLNPDDWKNLPTEEINGEQNIQKHTAPIADYAIASRNDGKLKVFLSFPPDYGFCDERTSYYDGFTCDVNNYLRENKIKHHTIWTAPSQSNHFRTTLEITPQIKNGELTKLYDTQNAVQKAIKNKDLVIVAGDGINDLPMLNPIEYLDKEYLKKCAENSQYKDFYLGSTERKLDDLVNINNGHNTEYLKGLKTDLTRNGFYKKIEELPLYSIVIKKENSKLKPLVEAFSSTGKVIEVENGQVDAGIKQAIKSYASKNKNFRGLMSSSFKNYLNIAKEKSKILPITIATLITLIGTAAYFKYIKSKNK